MQESRKSPRSSAPEPVFSATPAVFASLSDEARSLLEGLVLVADDPELDSAQPASRPQSLPFPAGQTRKYLALGRASAERLQKVRKSSLK
ncbi:MAG: hypothetical protein ACAI44_06190 [Candidatus Sericytochromatia bacterium]